MKRIGITVTIVGVLVFILLLLIFQRHSSPTIVCVPLEDSIRPRTYCVLNPFRDQGAEAIAERLLEELKIGNTDALTAYMADRDTDQRERYVSNERKYRITAWRNAGIEMKGEELKIQYWVSRANYPVPEEEVHFFFLRKSEGWKLRSYNAIY